jgi:hypothetical protein
MWGDTLLERILPWAVGALMLASAIMGSTKGKSKGSKKDDSNGGS